METKYDTYLSILFSQLSASSYIRKKVLNYLVFLMYMEYYLM